MSEHKYKEAYQNGIEKGRELALMEHIFSNCDEAYQDGYDSGRADAIDDLLNNISESIIWDVLAEIMKRNIGASDGADRIIDYLQKVAEKLKEKKNG